MANGTRSSRKVKDDEGNDSKGSQSSGKKSMNSGAAIAEASGHLEKQTASLNSMTPPAKRKSERIEKQKNVSPLRRSERGKMLSSSGSSGSKSSGKRPDSLDVKRKKEKKEKSVKQLTMETVEVNKIEQEDGQANEAHKKRMDARAYRAMLRKRPKKVNGTDHCDDLDGTDSGRREGDLLEELAERTRERAVVTSTSQSAKEALEKNNKHKLFPTSQKDSCKDMSSNGNGLQVSMNGLVAREMNDNAEKAALENLQSPQLLNSILHGGVLDCDISLELVQKVMPSESKGHNIDTDSVASPIMSSKDVCTSAGAGTLLSSGCKRKDCNETCGTYSKRQRVDCDSTKQEICSCDAELNQLFGSSDIKDRGKLDVGISTEHVEKPCNYMQQHMSSADLQTGSDQNTCIICKLDGKLLCCHGKGCQRSYHLSCLEPPLEEFPVGVWYCLVCVRKKLGAGVYSVSEGIEAIWDSRELEASEYGLRRQKQYFVKYYGLAHVHNRWVPENQVLLEASSLVAKYNRKNQGAAWKQHWALPHRILQKRLLMIAKECDEHHHKGHDSDKLNCHVEWLVKWCGLGYEHASWELENASIFSCPEGRRFIRDYETRRKKAKRGSKFDKGRIPNVIFSILFFQSDICKPFLIILTSTSLYSWDEEFLHLAPSTDVVVYSGSKEIRNSIRNLEFYEGGCIMFQVLITSPEVISEDNVAEYLNLLSLLDSQIDSNDNDSLLTTSSDNIVLTSEVRVRLCFNDKLRNFRMHYPKCCDHPYVLDQSLQMLLTKGLKEVEFLDIGIKASGKLQLLDAMLLEIKKRELKVLILFQYIGGSGRNLMGDILDDFLRQRFGPDSYERVDGGVIPSKKQSALNKFNNERERFVFLL
ncbi:hypothetical protein CRYUN_Cryun02cG0203900 [Craigia yunnanensis]